MIDTLDQWSYIWSSALKYLGHVWVDLALILTLLVGSRLLAGKLRPILEKRVTGTRDVRDRPGIVAVLLAQLTWVSCLAFLLLAVLVLRLLQLPQSHLELVACQLIGAWLLVIATFSYLIRIRIVAKTWSIVVWLYLASWILDLHHEITGLLDTVVITFGYVQVSLLVLLEAAFAVSIAIWIALAAGRFIERRIRDIDELTPIVRVVSGRIVRITLIFVAIYLSLQLIGLNATFLGGLVIPLAIAVGASFALPSLISSTVIARFVSAPFWHAIATGSNPLRRSDASGAKLAVEGSHPDGIDIFISYAREDRDVARRIAQGLEDHGWAVWWDATIPAGSKFSDVIGYALNRTRSVVVLWSRTSTTKDWVLEEAEEGRSRKMLIPVLIEAVELPRGFRRYQAADLTAWDGEDASALAFGTLVGDISAMIGPPVPAMEAATESLESSASQTGKHASGL